MVRAGQTFSESLHRVAATAAHSLQIKSRAGGISRRADQHAHLARRLPAEVTPGFDILLGDPGRETSALATHVFTLIFAFGFALKRHSSILVRPGDRV